LFYSFAYMLYSASAASKFLLQAFVYTRFFAAKRFNIDNYILIVSTGFKCSAVYNANKHCYHVNEIIQDVPLCFTTGVFLLIV